MKPPYPPDTDFPLGGLPAPAPDPAKIRTLGLRLFLVSLAVLFAASLLGYVVYRLASPTAPARGWLHLPHLLWASTIFLLVSTGLLHAAGRAAQPDRMRNRCIAAAGAAIAFVILQTPCIVIMIRDHFQLEHEHVHTGLYGLVMFLIALHALHVIGGLISLLIIAIVSHRRGRIDPASVRDAARFWHFLDLVWLTMFATFLLTA